MVTFSLSSCRHHPVIPPDGGGNNGGGGGNNGGGGGNDSTTKVCDPDTVYFAQQVLPILISNCAMSGCHDAATASDGVVLNNYQNVVQTADVDPGDPGGSDLYEVITDSDPDKRMPPPPDDPLSTEQITIIRTWIQQGAKNLTCDAGCDTTNVTYSGDIRPLLDNTCTGCHSGSSAGGGVDLSGYTGVKAAADNGSLFGAVNHDPGFSNMPQGGDKLPQCEIDQIRIWIADGAPQN